MNKQHFKYSILSSIIVVLDLGRQTFLLSDLPISAENRPATDKGVA